MKRFKKLALDRGVLRNAPRGAQSACFLFYKNYAEKLKRTDFRYVVIFHLSGFLLKRFFSHLFYVQFRGCFSDENLSSTAFYMSVIFSHDVILSQKITWSLCVRRFVFYDLLLLVFMCNISCVFFLLLECVRRVFVSFCLSITKHMTFYTL